LLFTIFENALDCWYVFTVALPAGEVEVAPTTDTLGKRERVVAGIEPIVSFDRDRNNVEHMFVTSSSTAEADRSIKKRDRKKKQFKQIETTQL